MGRSSKSVKGTKDAARYCVQCNHMFQRPSELKRHLETTLIHNPFAKKFTCDLCPGIFTSLNNLKNHKRKHFESPLFCNLPLGISRSEMCQRQYTDRSNLSAHIKQHHLAPFLESGLPIPNWLEDAKEERLKELRVKPKVSGATAKAEGNSSELSTSSSSPLATPSPKLDHSVQLFSAHAIHPPQHSPSAHKENLSVTQYKELELELLTLSHSATATESTAFPEWHSHYSPVPTNAGQPNTDAVFQSVPQPTSQAPSSLLETTSMGAVSWSRVAEQFTAPEFFFSDSTFGIYPDVSDKQSYFSAEPATTSLLDPTGHFDIMGQQVELSFYDYNTFPSYDHSNTMAHHSTFHSN